MWPDRVSNLGPRAYESGALPNALGGPAVMGAISWSTHLKKLIRQVLGTKLSTNLIKFKTNFKFYCSIKRYQNPRNNQGTPFLNLVALALYFSSGK